MYFVLSMFTHIHEISISIIRFEMKLWIHITAEWIPNTCEQFSNIFLIAMHIPSASNRHVIVVDARLVMVENVSNRLFIV